MSLSEPEIQEIEEQVREQFQELVDASCSLDTKRYFDLIDADAFVGLAVDGTNWNSIDDLRVLIEGGFSAVSKILSLEFSNVNISVIDSNTAVLVNEYEQSLELEDGTRAFDSGGGTQVWSRSGGEWRLVSISASQKPQAVDS